MKIRDLGITLISVDVIDPPDKATPSDRGETGPAVQTGG